MDAETRKAENLSIPQAFLLLATNDTDGKREVPVFALRTTLAGAILAELDLIGAIGLQGKHVRATGTAPQTDFQRELELIRGKSRPHTPKQWVSMLEGRAEVQRVYEGMASQGIVEHVGEKHLGRFRAVRYPEKNHAPEAALLQRIEAVLSGGRSEPSAPATPESVPSEPAPSEPVPSEPGMPETGPSETVLPESVTSEAGTSEPVPSETGTSEPVGPDPRITALIALLQVAGLLGKLFPAADRRRVMELTSGHWPARAVEDELRLVMLAEAESPTL